MNRMTSIVALISLSGVLVAALPAGAEVPTAADFAACNANAADETRTASVAPGSGDAGSPSGRPDDASGGVPAASPRTDPRVTKPGASGQGAGTPDPTGKTITGSNDPQLEGMAADRAQSPQYVAAYRSCMRQNGF